MRKGAFAASLLPRNAESTSLGLRAPLAHAALVLAVALACAFAPPQAFAYFNQVDDKNSAQQDIGDYGDAIAASAIPDGVYVISARTSSRMCVFYETADDAATRSSNKELCTLSVSGGSMTATFYLSPAYTHIYMGTGEQAAALTDGAGTDDSAYVRGEVVPVATSSGTANAYRYTMAVAALNSPVSFASFDGGSVGVANGKWFDRKVVFKPTDELRAVIAQGGASAESPDPGPDPDSSPAPGSGSGSATEPGTDPASPASGEQDDQPGRKDPNRPSKPSGSKADGGSANAPARPLPDAGSAAGARQDGAPETGGPNAAAESVPADRAAQAGVAQTGGRTRGVLMSPAALDAPAFAGEAGTVAVAQDQAERLSPTPFIAFALAVIALVGAAVRAVIFAAEKGGKLG